MNSSRQQNKFTRFMRTHAALLIIIFCMLAIMAVVLAVTLTRNANVIPDNPAVSNPGDDTPDDNPNDTPKPPVTKKVYFRKPVEYTHVDLEYTSGIGDDIFVFNPTLNMHVTHKGVDLVAADGTQVVAMYGGQVVETGKNFEHGNYVKIDHGNDVVATYASLGEVIVVAGQQVAQGEMIGTVSSTINNESANDAHLHLEIEEKGTVADPMPYVTEQKFFEVEED